MLKIDIEGMETQVLVDIKTKLHFVKNIVIEFHFNDYPKGNSLFRIISILEKAGFQLKFRAGEEIVTKNELTKEDKYIVVFGNKTLG